MEETNRGKNIVSEIIYQREKQVVRWGIAIYCILSQSFEGFEANICASSIQTHTRATRKFATPILLEFSRVNIIRTLYM